MTRQIKFRGKSLENGEWIYGFYYFNNRDMIYNKDSSKSHQRVDPNTVGRYYGLPDKNGKDIFEGDIISLLNAAGKLINVVCEFGTVRREMYENTVDITGFYFKLPDGRKTFPIVNNYAGKHDLELFEVIDNIHDNPELLKG